MTFFTQSLESRKPQQAVGVPNLEMGSEADDGDFDPEDKQLVSTTITTPAQTGEQTTLIN